MPGGGRVASHPNNRSRVPRDRRGVGETNATAAASFAGVGGLATTAMLLRLLRRGTGERQLQRGSQVVGVREKQRLFEACAHEVAAHLRDDYGGHHHVPDSEPITQVQRDSVITREDMPAKPFRIGVTLVTLGTLLLFFAFYFGIINV